MRPGLVFSSKTARQHQLEKRKLDAETSNNATSKKLKPTLKESLATPIDKSNKGFALLAKMGFKEGSGLGKSGGGIKDPVPLTMKTDRTGLGTETALNVKKEKTQKMLHEMRGLRDKAMRMQREQFKSDKQSLFYQKRMAAILQKNQRTCFQLDSEKVFYLEHNSMVFGYAPRQVLRIFSVCAPQLSGCILFAPHRRTCLIFIL